MPLVLSIATCPASEPHASPPSHTDHTDHTVMRSYGGLALRHPAAPAWHRSPSPPSLRHTEVGIPTLLYTEVGIPTSLYTEVGIPTSLFARKNPSPGQCRRSVSGAVLAGATDRVFFFTIHTPSRQSWRGHRIARKTPSPVREFVGPRRITPGVFFSTIQTPSRQSWRGHRIAPLNPGVGTGLPHSILAWAQFWRGRRIAPLNPGVGTGLLHSILAWAQDCPGVSQKTLEARLYTAMHSQTRRPDCPEKLCQRPAV